MAMIPAGGPDSTAPLEVRLEYLRRRRTGDVRIAAATAAIVLVTVWALLIGTGLFLH